MSVVYIRVHNIVHVLIHMYMYMYMYTLVAEDFPGGKNFHRFVGSVHFVKKTHKMFKSILLYVIMVLLLSS